MGSYKDMFSYKYSKLSCQILLLMVASSLFACGQADNNTSTPQNEQAAASTSKTAAPNTMPASAMTVSNNNSELLKNVSATVYKDVNCGCCEEWIDHAQSNGLSATAQHPENLSLLKDRYGVPNEMRSCHTAVTTDGYVFEGHVPAKYMAEFLENPPMQALGLAVPGMPVGSPGMEYQNKFAPYQIMQLNKDGSTEVYANIESPQQQL
ncbi:DUF411 domain-containing protein [Psychrobacter frigidicola]|uniref:DUF411 domain-containing protein n=1 Tax=Psychrobacter frigidicola TaxID=45611 RepID=UPI00191AB578|nr:DUF411 domain-containing protein [Psychrobacter frigidicola]